MDNDILERAEREIIGACFLNPEVASEISIEPDNFFWNKHKLIFAAIKDLAFKRENITLLNVGDYMQKTNTLKSIGGRGYLDLCAECCDQVISTTTAKKTAAMIFDASQRRRLAALGICDAYDLGKNPLEIGREHVEKINAVLSNKTMMEKPDCIFNDMEPIGKNNASGMGIKTGFHVVDTIIGGMLPGKLVILAARPGVGKSTLALQIARKTALENMSAYFSSEMSKYELQIKIASAYCGASPFVIHHGQADAEKIQRAKEGLDKTGLYVETKTQEIQTVIEYARSWHKNFGMRFLVLDYLQRYKGARRNVQKRYEEVGENARELKSLAQELEIPVLCLAQLNRDCSKDNRKPRMSDLRDSGEIEQEADVILFLHRDTSCDGYAELIVAKNRDFGKTCDVELLFDDRYQTYKERANEVGNVY